MDRTVRIFENQGHFSKQDEYVKKEAKSILFKIM